MGEVVRTEWTNTVQAVFEAREPHHKGCATVLADGERYHKDNQEMKEETHMTQSVMQIELSGAGFNVEQWDTGSETTYGSMNQVGRMCYLKMIVVYSSWEFWTLTFDRALETH